MLRLYDSRLSGNSWKVRILLSQLGLPYERVTLDIRKGDTHDPSFRRISRFARVPVLLLEDGRPIVESGAILVHLANGTPYLPEDPLLRADVLSWLFFEQADLQKNIATPRVLHLHGLAQFLQQFLLLLRQLVGRLHTDLHDEVTLTVAVQVRYALALDAEALTALRSFRNLQHSNTFQRFNLQLITQRSLREADRHNAVQIITIALEEFVGLYTKFNIQITRRAAKLSSFTFSSSSGRAIRSSTRAPSDSAIRVTTAYDSGCTAVMSSGLVPPRIRRNPAACSKVFGPNPATAVSSTRDRNFPCSFR